MPAPPGERIARLEQQLSDLRREFDDHVDDAGKRSNRMREVENALSILIEAHKQARRDEEKQYRSLEVKVQWSGLLVSLGLLVLAIVTAVYH